MKTVAVCGAFDPFHIGHLEHLRLASKLGDRLIVILNSDEDVIKKRGIVFMPMGQRYQILKSLRMVDDVMICIDNDGTVANTLLMLKPNIFAKGGDRIPETMPKSEIEVCRRIGCEIVYGIGDVLSTSTDLIKRIKEFKGEIQHKPSGNFK